MILFVEFAYVQVNNEILIFIGIIGLLIHKHLLRTKWWWIQVLIIDVQKLGFLHIKEIIKQMALFFTNQLLNGSVQAVFKFILLYLFNKIHFCILQIVHSTYSYFHFLALRWLLLFNFGWNNWSLFDDNIESIIFE